MEHTPQPQIEQLTINQLDSLLSPEQIVEKVSSSKKILRPGMHTKIRALVAASLVGLGGGLGSGDAEAQQHQYSQNTYSGQNNNTITHATGTVRVSDIKSLGHVVAMGAANSILTGANAPVRVGMQNGKPVLDINMHPRGPMKIMIEPGVEQQLAQLGYMYNGNPPVIHSISDPNIRLNIGPATSQLVITKSAGSEAVLVDITFVDGNNNQVKQKFIISKGKPPIQIA